MYITSKQMQQCSRFSSAGLLAGWLSSEIANKVSGLLVLRYLCKRLTRTTSCGFWLSPALASLGPEPRAKERIKGFMTKFSWVLQLGGCDTVRFVCLFLCLLSLWLANKISSCCSLGSVTWHTCLETCVANVVVIVQNHHRPSTWTPGLPTVSQTMGRSGIWA